MRWRGRRQSNNIEDRREQSYSGSSRGSLRLPTGRRAAKASGSSLVVLIIGGVILWMMGVSPTTIISMLMGGSGYVDQSGYQQQTSTTSTTSRTSGSANDETAQFIGVVLAEIEDVWGAIFSNSGETYKEPKLVMFSGQIQSACGYASSASGPFYCSSDQKVYIDLSFFKQLKAQYDAPGDFAQAYVIAHEVGHHVQNLVGILPKYHQMIKGMGEVERNKLSIRVELQADCYAGIWAHYTNQKGLLESGDVDEALNAASQIGDDTLQKRSQGYVVPDSFNHGTSAQRRKWFKRGYNKGSMKACDTFSAKTL